VIAAIIDPKDIYPESITTKRKSPNAMATSVGAIASKKPPPVLMPLPPLNPTNIDQNMTNHRKYTGYHLHDRNVFEWCAICESHLAIKQYINQRHCQNTFENVQDLNQQSPFPTQNPHGIRTSHISASLFPNIKSKKGFTDDHGARKLIQASSFQ